MLTDPREYSLYFHIPFCTRKCDYCHFYVIPNRPSLKNLFMEALRKEWQLRFPLLPGNPPTSIYFGGGTPSLLGPEYIAEILSWIPNLNNKIEITLEANPENITLNLMREYCLVGINRVSIGIQSLDDSLLSVLSRTHTKDQAIQAVHTTYASGIENITIDLMYDLPGQTIKTWQETLDMAISLPIQHLSLYNLTIEPHTVFYKKKPTLPNDEISLEMLERAIATLERAGLSRYEISAFARGDAHSKHNIGYWKGRPFLGFGPSAFSYWQEARFRNMANIHRYARALDGGEDPMDFHEKLTDTARIRERIAIAIRLKEGIAQEYVPETLSEILAKLMAEGLVESRVGKICLTECGMRYYDTVAAELIE